jgi:hypothetical protein
MANSDDERRQLGEDLKAGIRKDIPLEYRVMNRSELERLRDQGKLPREWVFALLGEHDDLN